MFSLDTLPKYVFLAVLLVGGGTQIAGGQAVDNPHRQTDSVTLPADIATLAAPEVHFTNRLLMPLHRIVSDQKQFWDAPTELRRPAAIEKFLPFAGLVALMMASDRSISNRVPANWVARSQHLSNYSVFALVGGAGGLYALGQFERSDHLRETGFLSGETALNSYLVVLALQQATRRERPFEGNGTGSFFARGSSFPLEHATLAWSVASIVAHEYPGPLTKLISYGLASAVSVTRVTGKQHFSSDVLVGSALGWYLGRQIFLTHHNPDLGGATWGDPPEKDNDYEKVDKLPRQPARMGSPYVPLDSWVYPAIERLAAFGYIDTAFVGMQPGLAWSALNCSNVPATQSSVRECATGNRAIPIPPARRVRL